MQVIDGLARRCASQEGNALAVCVRLGLAADDRVESLARSLVGWQWPDGGWNCDKRASGKSSSFHESCAPMWGLHEYAEATGAGWAHDAAVRCAEMFLAKRLFRSPRTGEVLRRSYLELRYPPFWHFDVLQGLLVLSRLGLVRDPRAADALDAGRGATWRRRALACERLLVAAAGLRREQRRDRGLGSRRAQRDAHAERVARPARGGPRVTIRDLWRERFGIDAPRKIVCVGLNYVDHATEGGREAPEAPILFAKFSTALIGPGEPIVIPREESHVDSEAELAVVIGDGGRRIPAADALAHVAGYTVANDVSARTIQRKDGQWARAKSFDTFGPLLPGLASVHDLGDGSGLRITQRLSGETLQDATTSDLIFDVPTLVAYASNAFTLEPGDVILTGTPSGVGVFRDPPVAMQDGDTVEVEIERIGVLSNPVVAES